MSTKRGEVPHAAHRDMRATAYQDVVKEVAQFERLAAQRLGKGKTHEDLRKDVARVVREAVVGINSSIEALRAADTVLTGPDDDSVLDRIEAAFEGRAAAAPDPAVLRGRVEEFETWRLPGRIPPGFEDRGKEGTVRKAGDYLIWAEILQHAAEVGDDIVFVTEDGKDDWWETTDGVRRPHRALALEFQRATGRAYHQIGLDDFVRLAAEAAGQEATEDTLDEIVAVREEVRQFDDEERSAVSRAYFTLGESYRELLWYSLVDELRPAQIAPVLGLTPNQVSARLYRARSALREAYARETPPEP